MGSTPVRGTKSPCSAIGPEVVGICRPDDGRRRRSRVSQRVLGLPVGVFFTRSNAQSGASFPNDPATASIRYATLLYLRVHHHNDRWSISTLCSSSDRWLLFSLSSSFHRLSSGDLALVTGVPTFLASGLDATSPVPGPRPPPVPSGREGYGPGTLRTETGGDTLVSRVGGRCGPVVVGGTVHVRGVFVVVDVAVHLVFLTHQRERVCQEVGPRHHQHRRLRCRRECRHGSGVPDDTRTSSHLRVTVGTTPGW